VPEWLLEFIPSSDKGQFVALIGLTGQVIFFSRWIVQWFASEKKKESHIPIAFWYCSLLGSLLVLTYGFLDRDLVVLLGQGTGTTVYIRNLVLLSRMQKKTEVMKAQRDEA
jgi:lipid-A-disaccharide synthase-like uncharacterized protein